MRSVAVCILCGYAIDYTPCHDSKLVLDHIIVDVLIYLVYQYNCITHHRASLLSEMHLITLNLDIMLQ